MEKRSWVYNSPCPDPSVRPVIRVYHDESTYYANADQAFFGMMHKITNTLDESTQLPIL